MLIGMRPMLLDKQRRSPGSKGRTASIGALGRRSSWPMTAKQCGHVLRLAAAAAESEQFRVKIVANECQAMRRRPASATSAAAAE